jgi:hypothetical protein
MTTKNTLITTLSSAWQMIKRAHTPFTKHSGTVREIAEKIISDCYITKKVQLTQTDPITEKREKTEQLHKFFIVSTGHFAQFYCRDFGMCVSSLIRLGHKDKCQRTVNYALTIFQHAKKVTTTIDHNNIAVDYFAPGPDSLAFLLHAIAVTQYQLNQEEKEFLNDQIALYYAQFWDNQAQTPIRNTYVSSAKDHYTRDASCYDFCMIAWTSSNATKLHLFNPFIQENERCEFENRLLELYWNGEYFFDDLTHEEYVASDAQIFPFFTQICTNTDIWQKANKAIIAEKLHEPYPVQYTKKRQKHKERFESMFVPNYEGNTIWLHIGLCYLQVLEEYDKNQMNHELTKIKTLVETHQNMLEVLEKNGKPYKSLFYKCDENLLWVSIFLATYLAHTKL